MATCDTTDILSSKRGIAFIGMSNCGKSYRSKQLQTELNYDIHCIDDLIEKELENVLQSLGFSGIEGLAKWMGLPYMPNFKANEKTYLSLEESVMTSVMENIHSNYNSSANKKKYIIDTTGSVIYLSAPLLCRLREEYVVINLDSTDDMIETMTHKYFQFPKPVIWGDSYTGGIRSTEGEDIDVYTSHVRHCYPHLLSFRRQKYRDIAHISIPASMSTDPKVSLLLFLNEIHSLLSSTSSLAVQI